MRNVFSKAILAAAQADPKVVLLTGDHGYALFDEFRQKAPGQFINAGIAEQNMVGVAAGLAKAGYKPIVYGLSAFVPIRVLEQIKIDVCYENLPVVFIGDGAGVVYSSLGSSHQSTEDIAALRCIPNINILSPCDAHEMQYAMDHALQFTSPQYIRMGKSDIGSVHSNTISEKIGDLISVAKGTDKKIAFLATGSMVKTAATLASTTGNFSVWSVPSIKPINEGQIKAIAAESDTIVVLEEHAIAGGLGSLVAEIVSEVGNSKVIRFGVQDRFSQKCGSYDYLLKEHQINLEALLPQVEALQQAPAIAKPSTGVPLSSAPAFLTKVGSCLTHRCGKWLIGLLLLAYFVLRCFYLDAVPRWDAGAYWQGLIKAVEATKAMSSWSELPKVVLETYNAYGHPSMGYFSLMVLGQLIDYPNQFILNMTNILLAMFSIFCVYKIFRWFLPKERHLPEVILATAIYAIEPLFFACSIFFNTDFAVLVFFTAALASLLYGRYGWFALASVFMIFSKETGIIFWLAMVGGMGLYALQRVVTAVRSGDKFNVAQLLPPTAGTQQLATGFTTALRMIFLIVPGIAFILFIIARKNAMWSMDTGIKFDSDGFNCFGFNFKVMANRAGEIFVLNFHWVTLLVTLMALWVWWRSRSKGQNLSLSEEAPTLEKWWGVLPVAVSFLGFLTFNLSYITYIIPRYVVHGGFFLILFTVLALQLASCSSKLRCAILAVILALFTVQTFRTVDPLSLRLFGSAPFNQHRILQIDSASESVGNAFVYNSEFTIIDKLFNRMQKAMPFQADTTIIAWNNEPWYAFSLPGHVFVDPVTLNRTLDWRNAYRYRFLNVNTLQAAEAPNQAFYVFMPWLSKFSNEENELALLKPFYKISGPTEIDIQGYSLRFYRLTRHSPE